MADSMSRPSAMVDDLGIYNEDYFNEALALEKKRSERSGRRFLLALIDISDIAPDLNGSRLMHRICSCIVDGSRETDLKGWYKYGEVLGVLFPDIRDLNPTFIKHKTFHKIFKGISKVLDLEQLGRIETTFHFFPGKSETETTPFIPLVLKNARPPKIVDAVPPPGARSVKEEHGEGTDRAEREGEGLGERKTQDISFGHTNQKWFMIAGDLLIILIAAGLSFWLPHPYLSDQRGILPTICAFGIVSNTASFFIFDLYNMGRDFYSRNTTLRIIAAILFAGFLSSFFFFFVLNWHEGRLAPILFMVSIGIMVAAWRMFYGTFFQTTMPKMRALILGTGETGEAIYRLLNSPLSPYEVRGFLDEGSIAPGRGPRDKIIGNLAVLGTVEHLMEIAKQLWAKTLIIAIPRSQSQELTRSILEARLRGMEVLDMPTVYERLTGRVPIKHIEDEWLLFSNGFYLLSKEYVQKIKRVMDVAFSGLLLLLFSPVIAVTALLIHLDSPGPLFYRQRRVGQGGSIFEVVKFRSMRQDAESNGAQWATKSDPRVTRVGKWIRLFRIDELPQLWSVFRGDMSLIGPRPERPEFVEKLEAEIPYYGIRHTVPPGVTGWAQVNYPYGASVEDARHKLEYDLYYIKNMSIFLDLKILLRTVGVVLFGEGAR